YSIGGHDYNQQSVRLTPIEVREELWLRRVLRKHLHLTDSPRAAHLLNTGRPLPFLRVEPVQPPCTIAETWAAILARLKRPKTPTLLEAPQTVRSEEPVLMSHLPGSIVTLRS